jgi:simple sugar transport system substrate-binding protein
MEKRSNRAAVLFGLSLVALAAISASRASADDKLNIVYTHHSSASNPFWQAVKKGFDDACAKIEANCQMIFTQTEGSVDQEVANQQAALARKPDALITTLVDNNAFLANLKDAKAKGVIVIASNVDATEGPELQLRQAFVGQNFVPAGATLGRRMAELFPKEGPIRVLVGINSPGQNWSEQRAKGILMGLDEFKKANPNREIVIDKLDVSPEGAVVADRVGAYLSAHPDTTAYIDTGLWHSNVARVLKDRGIPPGKVLLGGFDLAPQVIEQLKAGYIQVEIDQQPYEQGFLPVMQVYLEKKIGLAPADIDSGEAVFTPEQADQLMSLAKQGVR